VTISEFFVIIGGRNPEPGILESPGGSLKETPTLNCPDCGEALARLENSTLLRCSKCGGMRFLLSGQLGEVSIGDGSSPAITIHTLKSEVKELEKQLHALVERWGLIDLARNIGFILVLSGGGYALLSNVSSLTLLNYGVYGILAGILLHGLSQLVGKEYYIQKAFLEELILIKNNEIERQRSQPLKSGKISF
jgi:hypothetical protein